MTVLKSKTFFNQYRESILKFISLLFSPGHVRSNSEMEYNRLFVFVPKTDKEADLENIFNQYGEVSKVHIVTNKDTGESKGIAFITYTK